MGWTVSLLWLVPWSFAAAVVAAAAAAAVVVLDHLRLNYLVK